jgi:hypothetical protein
MNRALIILKGIAGTEGEGIEAGEKCTGRPLAETSRRFGKILKDKGITYLQTVITFCVYILYRYPYPGKLYLHTSSPFSLNSHT